MKRKYFIIIFLPLFIQTCSTNNKRIIGNWSISNFNVNGENYDGLARTKLKTIKFLENGFLILTATEKLPELLKLGTEERVEKIGGYTKTVTYNGKWKITGMNKIEIHFIGHPYLRNLRLQK